MDHANGLCCPLSYPQIAQVTWPAKLADATVFGMCSTVASELAQTVKVGHVKLGLTLETCEGQFTL